jgi:hypothetical protein
VHTIAIGTDANRPDLESLAVTAGGTYTFISEPAGGGAGGEPETTDFPRDAAEALRIASERVARQEQIFTDRGRVVRGGAPATHRFTVDGGASELVVAVTGVAGTELRDPSGAVHPPFLVSAGPTIGHRIYRVAQPAGGIFQLLVIPPFCPKGGCPSVVDYLVEASVKSILTMDVFLGLRVSERIAGRPMPILAAITDRGPVTNAGAVVEIQYPSGRVESLQLLDDGRHGDGSAGDGVYGETLRTTAEAGSYRLSVASIRFGAPGEAFLRRARVSFHMRPDSDNDGDTLPDGYELLNGLDRFRADADQDPDGDGLPNLTELERGTDPLDRDTDDDGEADGSEVAGNRNPLEPGDAQAKPPRACAFPGVGEVILHANDPPGSFVFIIERATENGPFQRLPLNPFSNGPFEFRDRDVVNGVRYRYRLISADLAGLRSAPSDVCEATPRTDPYPPHGVVLVNGGAAVVSSVNVTLTLRASDVPDASHHYGIPFDPRAEVSGVSHMLIANRADLLNPLLFQPFAATSAWTLAPNEAGVASVFVQFRDRAGNVSDIAAATVRVADTSPGGVFRRGDTNDDGEVIITDSIFMLNFLFLGGRRPVCMDALDTNDDGQVDISDASYALNHLFLGGPRLPAPYPECGVDPTPDDVPCASQPECP